MVNVIQDRDEYNVVFRYDPDIIDIVKRVPGRKWNPDNKYWTIPGDKLGFLVTLFREYDLEHLLKIYSNEKINKNETLDATAYIPDIDVSKVPFYVKSGAKPFKHQIDFMKFAIDRQQKGNKHGFLLADEQGLSKTAEVINLALYNKKQYGMKHCLVICCVNTAKFTWQDEIDQHTQGEYSGYILGTRHKRDKTLKYDTGNKEKYKDLVNMKMYGDAEGDELPFFLIMNIESIRYKSGKTYPICDRLIELIRQSEIGMVAMDEVHRGVSPRSAQGKAILRVKKHTTSSAQWIPMTGTPITSKPTDLFVPLKVIDAHYYDSYYKWCQNFCIYGGYGDYEIVGYKNMPELKAMLQSNMIRRLKKDVLDLPPKIHYTEYVENTPYQDKLYQHMSAELRNRRYELEQQTVNPLSLFLRLRQVNGSPELVDDTLSVDSSYIKYNAKLARLLELLADIKDRGEKVIIFSNWVEPLRTLYKFVAPLYNTCCYTGTMTAEDRDKHKRVFMTNPEYTVMLGTTSAMGVSLTLTAANNIIFYDEPWTPSDKEQAEDRAHRIGTDTPVNIYTILTKNTVDEKVHDILYTKKSVSNYIVDNKLDFKRNPKLVDLLLSHK